MKTTKGKVGGGLVAIAAIVVIAAGLKAAAAIMVPVLLAAFLAFISAPLAFRLHQARVPYALSVAIVLALMLGVLSSLGLVIAGTIARFRERLPDYRNRLVELATETTEWARDMGVPISVRETREYLDAGSMMDLVGATVAGVGSMLSRTVLVLLVVAFLLFDARRLWQRIDVHFGAEGEDHALSHISAELYRYLGVKTGTSAATGLLLGGWCAFLGVDFALLWGFLAFVLNYVPTVGSILAAIAPTLIALVMLGVWPAVLVAAGFLAVNTIVGSILEPRLLGQAVGLSPATVLLSLVAWGWILGPVGAILSVPLTMVVKVVLGSTRDLAWIADLMSAESPKAVEAKPPDEGPKPADAEPAAGGPADPQRRA